MKGDNGRGGLKMKWVALCICILSAFARAADAKVCLEKGVNQVQNWDFEQGILGLCITQDEEPGVRRCIIPDLWRIEDYTPKRGGRIELDSKEAHGGRYSMKVTNTSLGEVDWHFKVEQFEMSFEGGERHTIKFWAKAGSPREVLVCLQMSHEPYEGYLYRNVYLTRDWREFVIETIPEKDNDREHWLAFHCGQSLVTWWLDDVRYYKGGPDDEKESRPSAKRILIESLDKPKPSALHVEGSKLRNDNGDIVRLQGVNVPSLEFSNTGGDHLLESIRVAVLYWNVNTIRIPLCQSRWFGEVEGQDDGGRLYRLIVDEVVRYISENGCYVILDLHNFAISGWYRETYDTPEIYDMPDMKSLEFWEGVAARYANDPAVLFDLYNEPHDVSWDTWKFGGQVTTWLIKRVTYGSPGMQALLNIVRSTGAKNIVIAGGLGWGYDLRGIPEHALEDPYENVMYATHIYPWKGNERDWDEHVGHVIGKYPILVGEVGCEPDEELSLIWRDYDPYTWATEVLCYIHKHELNWTAWCFDPAAGPCILEDWTYTPTPYWGDFVKRALRDVPYIGDVVPPWDVNKDGRADILDLILIGRHFGKVVIRPSHPNPDVSGDGRVDISDFALVGQHFGEVYSPAAP